MEGVDLSRWRLALNGAEQVSVDAARRFSERFSRWGFRPAALMPVYGLAEAALAVTFSPPRTPLRTVPRRPGGARARGPRPSRAPGGWRAWACRCRG